MTRRRLLGTVLLPAWLAAVVAGSAVLLAHQSTPGASAAPPSDWPAASALAPAPGRFTLLLFAHPFCPCTRTTFGELAGALPHSSVAVDVRVVLVRPPGAAPGWENGSGLPDATAALPGARLVVDDGGREAGRFGAETSGTVLLYDPAGRLAFRGGITAGRGHAGDNAGRRALLAGLNGEPTATPFPVYGCPLVHPDGP